MRAFVRTFGESTLSLLSKSFGSEEKKRVSMVWQADETLLSRSSGLDGMRIVTSAGRSLPAAVRSSVAKTHVNFAVSA